VICGIAIIIISAIFMVMVHHRRKLREFFKRNGGPLLENINNIKIFTKEELNQISSWKRWLQLGIYGNHRQGQQVAVKRSISLYLELVTEISLCS